MAEVTTLGQAGVIGRGQADVARLRERNRQRRVQRSLMFFGPLAVFLWGRELTGSPVQLGWPHLGGAIGMMLPQILLVGMFAVVLLVPLLTAGRSPHVRFRPSEIEIGFADVRGMDVVLEEVVRTLNLFLGFKTFREAMGGTPRRGILFEGPPGTGKTYMAKALAKEAGVPFFYVSSSAFQSMYYGQTNRKIRSFFKALRNMARQEGGAIGFIEEIDAVGGARAGMNSGRGEGVTGVVNELLIQLQSFDTPPNGLRDAYATVGANWKGQGWVSSYGLGATYHHFDSDRLSLHYGDELDLIASAKVKRYTLAARFAHYRADTFATDTDKVFLTVDWVY